jgi:ribonuclease P protein component
MMATHFSLRISPSPSLKVVISVSKKVSKLAVTRNLVKRRVRAVLRPLLSSLKPASYLFIARSGAETIKGKALEQEFSKLLAPSSLR